MKCKEHLMNKQYQDLISTFSGDHNILLTSLLCTEKPDNWEECKHLIVCSTPLLTLEMAINRVTTEKRKKNEIPSPDQIQSALNYANEKKEQYLKHSSNKTLMSS